MAQKKQEPRAPQGPTLLQNKRFVMGISLLLAIVAWVVFAVIEGEVQINTITVPVRFDYTLEGTVAGERGWQAFWEHEVFNPNELYVDVVYESMRYITVRPGDITAELLTDAVTAAGRATLNLRVISNDRDRFTVESFTISGTSLTTVQLFFDRPSQNTFDLELDVVGDIVVPEGYFAAEPILLQRRVTVSGPQTQVRQVDRVIARVMVDEALEAPGAEFNTTIIPVDANGNAIEFLTIEDEVDARIPVWRVETLRPAVEFLHMPGALRGNGNGLRYSVGPANVVAALPVTAIPDNGEYIVGSIHARELSPEHYRFRFYAEDMSEIYFFNGVSAFEAVVDMEGFEMVTLTLPAGRVSLPEGSGLIGQFGSVANVTVVGPADVLEELTPEDLSGMVIVTDETPRGSNLRLALEISVDRDDSWVFGEYTVLGTLRGEE